MHLPSLLCSLLAIAADPAPSAFAVIDPNAVLRSAPPEVKPLDRSVPYGSAVVVLQEATVEGKAFVKVRLRDEPQTVFGWIAKSNLGSVKEFDPVMRPDDPVAVDNLSGIDRVMASIYNARGKYLHAQAKDLGVSPAALAAVLRVESGGRGFGADGRAIIRFENHVFWKRWGQAHQAEFDRHFRFDAKEGWKGHQWRRSETDPWTACHANQTSEWEVLEFARTLDADAATASASFGTGQIMGFNHKGVGFESAQELAKRFDEGIGPQLDATIAFIRRNKKCLDGLRAKDYTLFAEGYNGTGKAAAYGARIKESAESYTKVTSGRKYAE